MGFDGDEVLHVRPLRLDQCRLVAPLHHQDITGLVLALCDLLDRRVIENL